MTWRLAAVLVAALAAAAAAAPWRPQSEFEALHGVGAAALDGATRVAAELDRSVQDFWQATTPHETREQLAKLLSPALRDRAVILWANKTFATRNFLLRPKNEGLAVALAAARRRGVALPDVAFSHVDDAAGGKSYCVAGPEIPTTVIAKRGGYADCGVLVPNPFFGRRFPKHKKMGDLDSWEAESAGVRAAAAARPLQQRTRRVFWRGKCLPGPERASDRVRKAAAAARRREARKQHRDANAGPRHKRPHASRGEEAKPRHKRPRASRGADPRRRLEQLLERCRENTAGGRARLLGASLTAARPDLFDAKCNELDPPRNFSCAADAPALEDALRAVLAHRSAVEDPAWVAAENYTKYAFVLNMPGQTTGSYSRNLNHLWATGAAVLLWGAPVVEWYYPALAAGETHEIVDRATAVETVERLERTAAVSTLAAGAARVDRDHVCADCIAAYWRDALDAIRGRSGYDRLTAADVLEVARGADACGALLDVEVVRSVDHDDWTHVKTEGRTLCEALSGGRGPEAPVAAARAWAPGLEYAALHGPSSRTDTRGAFRRRVDAVLKRSLKDIPKRLLITEAAEIAARLFSPELRDSAVFAVFGKVFATTPFLAEPRRAGLAVLVAQTGIKEGVAFAHGVVADDAAPTTVFAKDSYAAPGLLVPAPRLGPERGVSRAAFDALRRAGVHGRSADFAKREPSLFWRGPCATCAAPGAALARLTKTRPDLFDARCSSDCFNARESGAPAEGKRPRPTSVSRHRYAFGAPGDPDAWAPGAAVLLWDEPTVEWYSPGLAANDTHVVVDAASVEAVVEGLNADPKAAAALAAGAARVRRGLVCPDCALDYARRLLVAIRDRVWSSNLLDNAAALLAVAERADACGAFVEAAPAEFGDETLAEVGQGLCEFLRGVVAEVKAAEG